MNRTWTSEFFKELETFPIIQRWFTIYHWGAWYGWWNLGMDFTCLDSPGSKILGHDISNNRPKRDMSYFHYGKLAVHNLKQQYNISSLYTNLKVEFSSLSSQSHLVAEGRIPMSEVRTFLSEIWSSRLFKTAETWFILLSAARILQGSEKSSPRKSKLTTKCGLTWVVV